MRMATLEFSTADAPSHRVSDIVSADMAAKLSEGELASDVLFHHPGADDRLQMFELRAPADATFNPHSHTEDEIMVVIDGELRAGSRVLKQGDSMYVPGGTVYSFRAGPEGVRLFNFRPRSGGGYSTPAETRAAARG